MFRIEYLKLKEHPTLGDVELVLSELDELDNVEKPYTTVIIGPNGTGKSFILRSIAEIFRQFELYSKSDRKEFNLPFDIHLRYLLDGEVYEIMTSSVQFFDKLGRKSREYFFLKNRPMDRSVPRDSDYSIFEESVGHRITPRELKFPSKLLACAAIPTDRFVYQKSQPSDFYQYLGARSSPRGSTTKSSVRRAIAHIFNASFYSQNFTQHLAELLNFLSFERSLKVQYRTRIHKLFFSGELTKENFRKYFEHWWDESFTFTDRKQDNPSWSVPYYNRVFKENSGSSDELIEFLNRMVSEKRWLKKITNSSSQLISIDLFDESISEQDLRLVRHLEALDIISLQGTAFQKLKTPLRIEDISSGEYNLLVSLISIMASISNNALILIDEPEISLHPNWQMRYISFLKSAFKDFSGSHFIITTHSHFLVSDLEGDSSAIIALRRDEEENKITSTLIEGIDPFGWSAEEVLFNVFRVRTTRNYYVELELRELLHMISANSDNLSAMEEKIDNLEKVKVGSEDPLTVILNKAKDYIKNR